MAILSECAAGGSVGLPRISASRSLADRGWWTWTCLTPFAALAVGNFGRWVAIHHDRRPCDTFVGTGLTDVSGHHEAGGRQSLQPTKATPTGVAFVVRFRFLSSADAALRRLSRR